MYPDTQRGKGLLSFMIGAIVSLITVAGVLFVINNNKQHDFKQPADQRSDKAARPEVLQPEAPKPEQARGESAFRPETPAQPESRQPEKGFDEAILDDRPKKTRPAAEDEEIRDKRRQPEKAERDELSEEQAEREREQERERRREREKEKAEREAAAKADRAEQERKAKVDKAEKADKAEQRFDPSTVKPSADQILESGSIEKARETAIREARRKFEREQAAKRESQAKTAKAEAKSDAKAKTEAGQPEKAARSRLRLGSYSSRQAADDQRARAAFLGVRTGVVEAEVKGRRVYRVETGALDSKEAERTRKLLQGNGIAVQSR